MYAISAALVLLSCAVSVSAGAVELGKYCTTLNQTQGDTNQCFEKPRQYTVESGDPFILAYMCCFGYFNDVRYIYLPFISNSFVGWFVTLTNSDTLQDIADFLQMCSKVLNGSPVLTEADYSYWAANNRLLGSCKAPSG